MRLPSFERLIVLIVAIAVGRIPFTIASHAAEVAVLQEAGTAVCEYTEVHDRPVITYKVTFGELAAEEPVPSIQVYGNGRVLIYRPPFMKTPGDYELWLSGPELDDLMASIIANGVLDFDENRVKTAVKRRILETRARDGREGRAVTFTYTVDAPVTELAVFLERYVPADPALPVRRNLVKRISWRNLAADACERPQISEIIRLAAAVEEISRLAKRRDLRRIEH